MIHYLKVCAVATGPENRPSENRPSENRLYDFSHCHSGAALFILVADQRRKYDEYVDSNRFNFGSRHIGGNFH